MGAREKLNGAYLTGAILVASAVGIASGSGVVFIVTAAAILAGSLANGEIRLRKRS